MHRELLKPVLQTFNETFKKKFTVCRTLTQTISLLFEGFLCFVCVFLRLIIVARTLWGHRIQTVLLLKVEQYFKYTSAFGKRQKHQKQMHPKAFYWLNRLLVCK